MSDWHQTTLGALVALQRGHDLPQGLRAGGTIPVMGSGGIAGWHNVAKVTGPGVTLGRAANLGIPTLVEEDFWPLNTTLYVTDFRGNDIRFVYHLFQTLDLSGYNSGSVQPMLNRNFIKNVPVLVPEPAEQRRVAAILGALDDNIAGNDSIATTYEELFRAKFASLGVTDGGDIAVTDLVTFNPKTPINHSKEAIYVDMAALPTRLSSIQTWMHRTPKGGSRFQNGDTLLARITPCLENGKTGYVDFLSDGETGAGSTEFIVMRSKNGVPPEFSYFLARDERFRKHAIQKMVGSSGRQRVSATDASDFLVNRPDPGQLSTFGAEAGTAFRHLRAVMEESRALRNLRDVLLPELMSGRLRVKDAEKIVEESI
ncbi:restriction endonuclease subunit S [Actinoplanes xinjiangensis]|uniref:restriction endonuclease subunit S n=1 Tax=Actinoplanes xinjiangensis TaxID=512350 RepID=UPI00344980DB